MKAAQKNTPSKDDIVPFTRELADKIRLTCEKVELLAEHLNKAYQTMATKDELMTTETRLKEGLKTVWEELSERMERLNEQTKQEIEQGVERTERKIDILSEKIEGRLDRTDEKVHVISRKLNIDWRTAI